jgi:chromosome segregation ATPase
MLWMITKFIFCLLAAGIFGFIVGWVLSSLIKNEKLEAQYSQIKDDVETKRAELNQAYSDLDAKEHELEVAEKNIQQLQKELLMKNMDLEEYQKHGLLSQDPTALELENNTLKEEISEYKYLENENELLHNELKELSLEKERLLQEIDKYRNTPVALAEDERQQQQPQLKDAHIKVLQKDLKSARKKIARMDKYLKKILGTKKKKSDKKEELDKDIDATPLIFDFNQKPSQPQ